ncbi:DNA mismatch repair protein MutT [Dokdonia pacifica]|uniref:ADP-ribose pyrophosphatase YjhB, NUDIX family n=1 Tax=Dokdonia pacifica TaxID=1627892 RepID=A0A238VT77_9FLAO|nr:NUDIX domain-containing protein [Dokdonia pacifica]GGG17904.1 DNA mismatch repair protein MutT [Dokdonia pacifica]SNR37446.1 ADP-ribose pyrophosphatase YjhB, NUDIX family [Dokdonia pacifica]
MGVTSTLIDKIALIETKDRSILSTRSKGKEKYYIPGGKREGQETDTETLIREIKEELSVTIHPSSINYLGTFTAPSDGAPEGVQVQMTCYTATYSGTLAANSEIEEVVWLTYQDIEKVSAVDKIIFNFLKDRGEL